VFQYGTTPTPTWQEFFSFDRAGHLWRTNSGDGVYKIYFYNLAGQVTYQLTSNTVDLSTFASSQAADNGVGQRTHQVTVYDLDGRVIQQRETISRDCHPPSIRRPPRHWIGGAIPSPCSTGGQDHEPINTNMLNQVTQTTLPVVTVVDTRSSIDTSIRRRFSEISMICRGT